MKKIQLKSLSLLNFKGIKSKTIDFGPETFIFGANRAGKTTLEDAWNWLLFGKDSKGRTQFEIKTLDDNNNPIPKINHEVKAVINVDGEEISIKRVFKEKWVRRRGSDEHNFGGNETEYSWNDVPMTQRDYQAKISQIIDEHTFKLITSPAAFPNLPWQDQRKALIAITGEVSDQDVAKGNPEFESLLQTIGNKTFKGYEDQLRASIRKANSELKTIPTRIDEVERGKPEERDWKVLDGELKAAKKELENIDSQIQDKLEADKEAQDDKRKLQNSIYELERKIDDVKHQIKLDAKTAFNQEQGKEQEIASQMEEVESDIVRSRSAIKRIQQEIDSIRETNTSLAKRNDKIRADWEARNAEVFEMDPDDCACPTCKQQFKDEDIEIKKKEMEDNFKESQKRDLEDLSKIGVANKQRIEAGEADIEKLEARIEKGIKILSELEDKLLVLQKEFSQEQKRETKRTLAEIEAELLKSNEEIPNHQTDIQSIKEEMEELKPVSTSELKEKRKEANEKVQEVETKLRDKKTIEDADKRVEVLGKEEQKLSQEIVNMEGDQFLIEQFNKAKMDKLESNINNRFQLVKFKLFDQQVNGGETPTCKALINGVPYTDANTESQVNMGIDIINTLSDHYQVSAPVFIDNRESVTELIPSDSQLINLIVSPKDKTLRVEAKELVKELF